MIKQLHYSVIWYGNVVYEIAHIYNVARHKVFIIITFLYTACVGIHAIHSRGCEQLLTSLAAALSTHKGPGPLGVERAAARLPSR